MKKLSFVSLIFVSVILTNLTAQTNLSGDIGGMTLTADTEWIVLDSVWVEDGDTLTIRPGTTIKFTPGIDAYMLIKRGAYIHAQGTEDSVIVFTSASDNPNYGDWKCLQILGNGIGQLAHWVIDSTYNAGILRYLVFEYNYWGVGLHHVGSGTTVDHISILHGWGFHILGGNVNISHISIHATEYRSISCTGGYSGSIDELFINGAVEGIRIYNTHGINYWDDEYPAQDDPDALPRTNPVITHVTMTNVRDLPIRFSYGGVGSISKVLLYDYLWAWGGIRCDDNYLLSEITIDSIQYYLNHRGYIGNNNTQQIITNVIEQDPLFAGFIPTNSEDRGAMTGGDWLSSWGRYLSLDSIGHVYLNWIGTSIPGDTVYTDLSFGLANGNMLSSADVKIVYDTTVIDLFSVERSPGFSDDATASIVHNVVGDTIAISLAMSTPHDPAAYWDAIRLYFYVTDAYEDTSTWIDCMEILVNEDTQLWTSFANDTRIDIPELLFGDVSQNNDITSYDASLILQSLVGYINLDNVQEYVANVSGNEGVTAYDASLIQQYMVNLIDIFPADTGSYSPQGSGDLMMNDDEIQAGQQIDIPLYLSDGDNIMSFEGLVTFNQEHLIFDEIVWSALLNNFTIEVNLENNEIIFAGAGAIPDGQEGVFATLRFTVNDDFDEDQTTVSLFELRWNEEAVMENIASSILTKTLSIEENIIPTTFRLSQNYPNPFNPVTTISYQLPKYAFVNLYIYNVTGQLVETIVSEYKNIGYHSIIWNAENVGSGLYFYRIEAGEYSETKKCLILK